MRYLDLLVVLPLYGPYGNGSLLYYFHQEEHCKWKAQRVMEEVFSERRLSLCSSQKIYGKRMNLGRNVPLVVDERRIFLPIKVRKPLLKNDGAYGFVRYDQIDRVEGGDLILNNQRRISTLHTRQMLEVILGRGITAHSLALGEREWIGLQKVR